MKPSPEQFIIFSHGFGVDKTDRGLFSDILAKLDGVTGVMFDYNQVNEATGDMTVRPLSEQAEALEAVITTVREHHDGPIDMICHSQGCVVAGMVAPEVIRKMILLTPAIELNAKRSSEKWGLLRGSVINVDGESKLNRADGSVTTVPKEYWQELDDIKPIELYGKLSEKSDVTMIIANQDHVLTDEKHDRLSEKIKMVRMDGDHNFSSEGDREVMIHKVKEILGL